MSKPISTETLFKILKYKPIYVQVLRKQFREAMEVRALAYFAYFASAGWGLKLSKTCLCNT